LPPGTSSFLPSAAMVKPPPAAVTVFSAFASSSMSKSLIPSPARTYSSWFLSLTASE